MHPHVEHFSVPFPHTEIFSVPFPHAKILPFSCHYGIIGQYGNSPIFGLFSQVHFSRIPLKPYPPHADRWGMIEQERRIDPYRATLDYMIETLVLCGYDREEIEKELEEVQEQAQLEQENTR
jgi:hypothetical protein